MAASQRADVRKPLPVVALQAPSRDPQGATDALASELDALMQDLPDTRLVVLPEYHLCRVEGSPTERARRYRELAEPIDGPRVTAVREVARRLGVWLVPGTVPELGEGGGLFNTTLLVAPDGVVAGTYRKVFPWRPFEPWDVGSAFTVVDIPEHGRVGFAICYDLWFPEVARHVAWLGAELLIIPTQTSTIDREQELVLTRATAIQNQLFVLGVNAAAPAGTGRSLIVDPEGLVRVQAPSEAAAVLTDVLDLERARTVRRHGTCGLNRLWAQPRPEDPTIPLPLYAGELDPVRWRKGMPT